LRKRKRKELPIENEEDYPWACNIDGCTRRFKQHTQLGGHKSKAHPKSSPGYLKKMEKRKDRESEREYLKLAKQVFTDLNPGVCMKEHRNKVTYIKNKLKIN